MRIVLLAALLAMQVAFAAEKKFVYCGWDLGRARMDELAASADLFSRTAADGVAIYAAFKDAKGSFRRWNTPLAGEAYDDATLAPYVPTIREFVRKSGLAECFLSTSDAPKKRLDWRDDDAWRRGAENFAVLARFAKAAGLRGLIADFEDYPKSRQFTRIAGDPDYEDCRRLARRRGAEFFGPAFRVFPEMRVLAYYFFTSEMRYVGCADPVAAMRNSKDLYPAFLNGALDVSPDTVRFIDGNEIGYRLEASRGDFWRYAEHQRHGILPLVEPENRDKYFRQVGLSFGQYVDSYIYGETSEYYKGPLNGSRLAHFRENLAQATALSDEYVWLWNEFHPYVRWHANERCADLLAKGTLEELLPGVTTMLQAVKDPSAYLALRGSDAYASKGGFYQGKRSHGTIAVSDFGGRKGCYVLTGVADGCVYWSLGKVKRGEAFAFAADWKGDGAPSGRCAWRQNGYWIYSQAPLLFRWGEARADGWRHGDLLAAVPDGVDEASFSLDVCQESGETAAYDAVRFVKIVE